MEFPTQNVHMLPLGRLVVVILVIGILATSLCAQSCNIPQSSASDCPQHHHSGNTNCCEHSSTDATMTAKVDCALGLKSTALIFIPLQSASISSLLNRDMNLRQMYGAPDSVLQYAIQAPPSVLRV